MPHLKRGCIRDFLSILGPTFDEARYNRTDHIYHFDKADIEFFPADDSTKLRGGRRDILFINEANNVSLDAYNELDIRTRACTFIDYNPVSEFWAHERIDKPGVAYIHSTYMDARHVLPPEVVEKIERRKGLDPNWWRVYGLGEVGNVEGLVHPVFTMCDDMPAQGDTFYGLDFGYTNDPTALVKCVIVGDSLFCDQLIYETGLTNDAIARRLESLGVRRNFDEVYADCAEPKSIAEIKARGYNVKPAMKGADSLLAGIQRVNQYRQHWTKRSVDAIKEQRNYRYVETSDGKITNKPIDDYNHAMDARRYALFTRLTAPSMSVHKVAY